MDAPPGPGGSAPGFTEVVLVQADLSRYMYRFNVTSNMQFTSSSDIGLFQKINMLILSGDDFTLPSVQLSLLNIA